jgi:hypothetical protein
VLLPFTVTAVEVDETRFGAIVITADEFNVFDGPYVDTAEADVDVKAVAEGDMDVDDDDEAIRAVLLAACNPCIGVVPDNDDDES